MPVRERPSAGRPSGSHGRRPAHAASARRPATPGTSSRRRAPAVASVTAGSTLVSNPRRSRLEPDQHVRRRASSRSPSRPAAPPPAPRPRRGSRRRPPCGGCRAARASRTSWPLRGSSGRWRPAVRASAALHGPAARTTWSARERAARGPPTRVVLAHACIARRLLRHRPRDRPRVALEVAGHPGRAEQPAPSAGLERARLAGLEQLALDARRAQPLDPRRLGRQARLGAVDDERALAADPRALAVARLDLVVGGAAEHRELELRPRRPCPSTARCPRRARSCRPTPRRRRAARPRRRAGPARAAVAAPTMPAPTTATFTRAP